MQTLVDHVTQSVVTHRAPGAPVGWNAYLSRWGYDGFHLREEWSRVLEDALNHRPHFLWATDNGRIVGVLPLMHVAGPIFGEYLVSMPYTSTGGVLADSDETAKQLISDATDLADDLNVKHLELRHERHIEHSRMTAAVTEKRR